MPEAIQFYSKMVEWFNYIFFTSAQETGQGEPGQFLGPHCATFSVCDLKAVAATSWCLCLQAMRYRARVNIQ